MISVPFNERILLFMKYEYLFVIVMLILIVGFAAGLFHKSIGLDMGKIMLATFALLSVPLISICIALVDMARKIEKLEKLAKKE